MSEVQLLALKIKASRHIEKEIIRISSKPHLPGIMWYIQPDPEKESLYLGDDLFMVLLDECHDWTRISEIHRFMKHLDHAPAAVLPPL